MNQQAQRHRLTSAVTITNASAQTLTEIVITGQEKTAKLSRAMKPQASAVLKLPSMNGCIVSIAAKFEDGAENAVTEHDVCKDNSIRFTD